MFVSLHICKKYVAYFRKKALISCNVFIHTSAAYLADIVNKSVKRGENPRIYKFETCTHVPKQYPVQYTTMLRNICGLLTFDKVMEQLLAELMISDMEKKFDLSQFGNQNGVSIQHYLVQDIISIG